MLQRGTPQPMFSMTPYYNGNGTNWAISAEGQRLLMVKKDSSVRTESELTIVQNWLEELKRLVPVD